MAITRGRPARTWRHLKFSTVGAPRSQKIRRRPDNPKRITRAAGRTLFPLPVGFVCRTAVSFPAMKESQPWQLDRYSRRAWPSRPGRPWVLSFSYSPANESPPQILCPCLFAVHPRFAEYFSSGSKNRSAIRFPVGVFSNTSMTAEASTTITDLLAPL